MGTFDGVHLGHQKLLAEVVKRARSMGGESVVITYFHHPLETINKNPYPYLLTERLRKEQILRDLGIEKIVFLEFNKQLASLSASQFLEEIMIDKLGAKEIVFGYDTHFGAGRTGDFSLIKSLEKKYDYKADIVEPFCLDGATVSSSYIRDLLRSGNVRKAASLLGRNYTINGLVTHGKKLGHKIGFPTINLQSEDQYKLIPKVGVYLSQVVVNGSSYYALTDIGYSPTLKHLEKPLVETYILDFDKNIYGQAVSLSLLARIRDEQEFDSVDLLIAAIRRDIDWAREYLKNVTT